MAKVRDHKWSRLSSQLLLSRHAEPLQSAPQEVQQSLPHAVHKSVPQVVWSASYIGRLFCLLAIILLLSSCDAASSGSLLPGKKSEPAAAKTRIEKSAIKGGGAADLYLSDEQIKLAGITEAKVGAGGAEAELLELSSTVESPADATGIVYSPAGGVVTRVLVDVGDTVKKGQIVAYVNSPEISDAQAAYLDALAKLSEAKAQLEAVDARIEVAKLSVNRMAQLNKEGIAAKKDVENASAAQLTVQSEKAIALGKFNAARAHIEAEKVKLRALGLSPPGDEGITHFSNADNRSYQSGSQGLQAGVTSELPIRSPVSGVVVRKDVNPGQSVGPATMGGASLSGMAPGGNRNSLLTIADLKKVWVMLEVPQREVPRVQLGGSVDFRTESFPGRSFTGKITRIAQTFDPASHTAQYRAEINNPGALLKPGMLIIAELRTQSERGGLAVPPSAVQEIANKSVVFLKIGKNQFQSREVQCGERTDRSIRILRGLKPGEQVVVGGSFYLKSQAMRAQLSGEAE